MNEKIKNGLRHHVVAGARDILVVSAVMSLLTAGVVGITRPYWEPFVEIPVKLQEVTNDVEALRQDIKSSKPTLVDFMGTGVVSNRIVNPGDALRVVYTLRRNISCDTRIIVRFWDHKANSLVPRYNYIMSTQKAPVTEDFINFPVRITVPNNLPAGTYSYAPEIIPENCGIYKTQLAPLSEVFEVLGVEDDGEN